MAEVDASVRAFLDAVTPERRRRDAETLVALMARATGQPARLWGTIVGFGQHHYRYASGREGDTFPVGFAPRKAATTVYLWDGLASRAAALERLGPHATGTACLYLKDVGAVDLAVLESLVTDAYQASVAVAGTGS
jgi:hypothetical protein